MRDEAIIAASVDPLLLLSSLGLPQRLEFAAGIAI